MKKLSCILVALMMIFCLSAGNLAGTVATADGDTYLTLPTKGGQLSSGIYKLTENVTVTSSLQVSSVETTIDLNGYTISGNIEKLIYVSKGTLNVIDSSADGTGRIENKSSTKKSYAIKLGNSSTLNIYGGTISSVYYGICTDDSSCVINIMGGEISSTDYMAVYSDKSSITISGTDSVKISSLSTSSSDAYGIYSDSASVTISNPNTYVSGKSGSVYKKNSSKVSITAGHYSTDVSTYVPEDYICSKTDDADYPYVVTAEVVEPEVVLPVLYGEALTLDGSVGVTFYFSITDVTEPETYVLKAKIGEDGEEQDISPSEPKTLNGVEYYRYTVYVKPNEFSTTVYACLTDGTNTTKTYGYSVYDYCIYAIKNNMDESDLCEALLNYGDYASAYYYGTSQNSFENVDGWVDPVTEEWTVDLNEYAGTETTGVAKSLLLGSSVVIRLYMTSDVASEDDVFSVDGTTLELHSEDDVNYAYYVEFPVSASDMAKTFTVMKNGEELTSYSVLSYVRNITEAEGSDTELSNLCKAIYYYSIAASAYTGWQ